MWDQKLVNYKDILSFFADWCLVYSIFLCRRLGKFETTRPFRYDLNQILYDYTVEVRNRFKGLDLIDRVPDELWTEVRDAWNIVKSTHQVNFCGKRC